MVNRQKQEERFIEWVKARDDDWWEDEARISIWDFRIMQEFFNQELQAFIDRAVREREEKIKDIDFAQVHFYLEDEAEKWKGKPEDFDIYELTNKWCEEQISQLTDSEK